MTIPIFVIVKDRIKVLEQSMESWLRLIDSPIEIILLDQESTYPGMLHFLEEKKKEGMRVFHLKNTVPTDESKFPALGEPVRQVCNEMNALYYVLTDPDIMFKNVDGDILEFYTYFLETNPWYDAIGPMLVIDDIPDYYPFKAEVIRRHAPFWAASGKYSVIGKPKSIKYQKKVIQYKDTPNDTTFALRPAGSIPYYTSNAIRTRMPYVAKHLDWYIDPNDLSEDQQYYIDNSHTHKGISHWAGTWMKHPESLAKAAEKNRMPKWRK